MGKYPWKGYKHKPCPLTVTENRHLWMVIPKQVAFDYIPKKYHGDMQALMDQGQWVNPLFYKADKNLIHKLRILRDQQRYKQRYASSMEKANG